MNILITGASGLIGTAIIENLQSQDHKIYAISRSNKKSNGNINWIKHDLYNDPISSLILPKEIDVVFHISGQTSIYDASDEGGLLWNDPDLAIKWPIDDPIITTRDNSYPKLSELNLQ